MKLERRQLLGLTGAAAALSLAGCGGGDGWSGSGIKPFYVLNLHPEFSSVDVTLGSISLATALPFQGLTPRNDVPYGSYTLTLTDRISSRSLHFDGLGVDAYSPAIGVFYRNGTSARLYGAGPGIVNDLDSTESLIVELDDGTGSLQITTLAFEQSVAQASGSLSCRLRLKRASDSVLVYDSGLRTRSGAILIHAGDPSLPLIGVVALDYSHGVAAAVTWPNTL
jgi:hypothetical protein